MMMMMMMMMSGLIDDDDDDDDDIISITISITISLISVCRRKVVFIIVTIKTETAN